jgi:hypothetical protein
MSNDEVIDHQEVEQEVQEAPDQVDAQDEGQNEEVIEEQAEKQVPLAVLQKERKKRQEAEMNAQYQYQQRMEFQNRAQPEPEEDSEEYESATRQELKRSSKQTKEEAKREIKEELWSEANPEKIELVGKHLDQFLKQRPSYADAIKNSTNRYKEGYDLIKAFMFNEKPAARQKQVKRDIPNSPTTVPKIAAFNGKVDVMRMNDKEFNEWRSSQRKR